MSPDNRFVRSARLISALTLLSRVLGLAREQMLAFFFSTSQTLSAFRIAFMLPNLARRLFGEGALSAGLIPVLTRRLHAEGEAAARRFVGSLLALLTLVLVLAVVAVEAALLAVRLWSDDLSLSLAAVVMPYMVLICLVAAVGAVLNVRHHFAVPAAAPALLNVSIIAGVLVGAVGLGLSDVSLIYAACVAVLAGGAAQLLLSLAALRRIGFTPLFTESMWSPPVRSVGALMAPMVVGLSAVQINTLVDFSIAYLAVEVDGERVGPAVMGFAQYLYQLPLGVFGIALATAIFPVLSRQAEAGDHAGVLAVFARGLRLSVFVALPASVGLMLVARPLVAALYERGEFDTSNTARVSGVLVFYAIGMAGYFAQHIVVRTFYALHDSRTPARVAMGMVLLNLAMNLALVFVLEERGLALATAVCAFVQVSVLLTILSKRLRGAGAQAWRGVGGSVVRSAIATALMGCCVAAVGASGLSSVGPIVETLVLVTVGVVAYGVLAMMLNADELRVLLRYGK